MRGGGIGEVGYTIFLITCFNLMAASPWVSKATRRIKSLIAYGVTNEDSTYSSKFGPLQLFSVCPLAYVPDIVAPALGTKANEV